MSRIAKSAGSIAVQLFFVLILAANAQAVGADSSSGQQWLSEALKRHVKNGLVDYNGMAKDQDFKKYQDWVANAKLEELINNTGELPFWVNLYNAMAIQGVIENMPVKKVIDVPGFFDKRTHTVAGHEWTLNHIEKEIIFKKFREPRLHFVLVCAALSCPPLQSEIYTAANFDKKLDAVARIFINNPKKNYLDRKNKIMYLSQIFNWYQKDFVPESQSILKFVKPYLSKDDQAFLEANRVEVKYLDYDWRLNSQ